MTTNKKNEFPVINAEDLNASLTAFMLSLKGNEEEVSKEGINLEDIKDLTKSFVGKTTPTALYAATIIITVLPIEEFLTFSGTFRTLKRIKLSRISERMKFTGADNDIDK